MGRGGEMRIEGYGERHGQGRDLETERENDVGERMAMDYMDSNRWRNRGTERGEGASSE